jgi:hypothetical protein
LPPKIYALQVLGARGALLAVLADFFEQGRWGVLAKKIVEGEKLSVEDQVFLLMQAALYLTPTRDWSVEARNCWEQMESLCRSLNSASPAVRSADGPVAHFQQH